eukprot:8699936-Lingulodinium_polyedra.AAC.1
MRHSSWGRRCAMATLTTSGARASGRPPRAWASTLANQRATFSSLRGNDDWASGITASAEKDWPT